MAELTAHTSFFHALSDTTRLRALYLMHREGELCVCELVAALGLAQPKVSRHLAALRDAGLVVSRRDAQWVFHAIRPDLPGWQKTVLHEALEALAPAGQCSTDEKRLGAMKNRPDCAA